jgi:hypothetical protein
VHFVVWRIPWLDNQFIEARMCTSRKSTPTRPQPLPGIGQSMFLNVCTIMLYSRVQALAILEARRKILLLDTWLLTKQTIDTLNMCLFMLRQGKAIIT